MDPRTLLQLLTITREERLFDKASPPKWSDEMLARALSEGEREAARTAKLILDGRSRFTLLTLVEGQSEYLLDPSFFELHKVRYEATGRILHETEEATLDRDDELWRTRTSREPRHYVVKTRADGRLSLVLSRVPDDLEAPAPQLRIEGYRTPVAELRADGDEPEIAPHYHEALIDWACYRAYSIRHPDQYDPVKAADHLATFRAVFGPAIDANQRRAQGQARSHVTVPRSC